jgi:hypothetical protein
MRLYLLKENMIKYVSKCPNGLVIPTNDFQAYEYYKNHNHLYNKKFIAQTQNILYGDNKTYPNTFPVIIKPIVNLYGMGKDAYIANDKHQIENIPESFFWSEILHGPHISVDVFYNNNTINGTIAFYGEKDKLFTFKYWEYLENYILPSTIIDWINIHLVGFNGVLNIEIIGGKIIECHLRMGDLNFFQNKILTDQLIHCYEKKSYIIPKLNKIYLVPIFVKKGEYIKIKKEDLIYCAKKTNTYKHILNYFIDPSPKYIDNPVGGDRICIITTSNLQQGLKLKHELFRYYNMLKH